MLALLVKFCQVTGMVYRCVIWWIFSIKRGCQSDSIKLLRLNIAEMFHRSTIASLLAKNARTLYY